MYENLIRNSLLFQLKGKWNIPIEFSVTKNTFNILVNGKIYSKYDFFEEKELKNLLIVMGDDLQKSITQLEEVILTLEKKFSKYIKMDKINTFTVEDETFNIVLRLPKMDEGKLQIYLCLQKQSEDEYEIVTDDFGTNDFGIHLKKTFYDIILEKIFNKQMKKIYQQTNKEAFSERNSRVYLFVEHVGENDVLILINDRDRPSLNNKLLDKRGKIDDIAIESEKILTRLFKQRRLERLFS